jgi:hypothetical protein
MAIKGYTNPDRVADYLGVSLTAAQIAQAARLIEAAEAAIDAYCGRAWLLGVQTDEAHYAPFTSRLYVRYPPCSAITTVKARASAGDAETVLVSGEDYEVRSLEDGLIWLASPEAHDRIRVTYTPDASLPADVALAATELVASYLQPALRPDSYGLESFRLPDLEVRFARWQGGPDLPPGVMQRLGAYVFTRVA